MNFFYLGQRMHSNPFNTCYKPVLSLLVVLLGFSCEETDPGDEREHQHPRVEIDMDERYLWSQDSGLYVIGSNGIASNCNIQTPANYNQKWWRERNPDGDYHRWRWIAIDMDKAFMPAQVDKYWIGDLVGNDLREGKRNEIMKDLIYALYETY